MDVEVALQAVAVLIAFAVSAWKAITQEITKRAAGIYPVLAGLSAAFLIDFADKLTVR